MRLGKKASKGLPLYEDLVRRAVAAQQKAAELSLDAGRISNLAQTLRDAHAGRVLLPRCAWCDRFRINGEWLYLDAIGNGQHRITARIRDQATHGICDDCLKGTQQAAETARRHQRSG